jgi:hypothetical protein
MTIPLWKYPSNTNRNILADKDYVDSKGEAQAEQARLIVNGFDLPPKVKQFVERRSMIVIRRRRCV